MAILAVTLFVAAFSAIYVQMAKTTAVASTARVTTTTSTTHSASSATPSPVRTSQS